MERKDNAKERMNIVQDKDFEWTKEKDVAFQAIKQSISNNAMALLDPEE